MHVKLLRFLSTEWPLAFAVFFLINAAWALACPYAGSPDEVRQIIRAAGVAEGQVFARPVALPAMAYTGAYQSVPSGLVRGGAPGYENFYCYLEIPTRSAACGPVPGGPGANIQRTYLTGNGRYNPIYYAAVGGPLVALPDWTGILLARLISAALCAGFLASAWLSCREWRRSPMLIAGLVIAATPAFFEMAGAIDPNSLEMAAGISLAAAAIPLLLDEGSPDAHRWLRRAAVAAIGIGQFRALGPELIACLLAVLLIPPARARLRYVWQLQSARWWSAGVVVSCFFGTLWTIAFKTYVVAHLPRGTFTLGQVLKNEATGHLLKIVRQIFVGFAYVALPPSLIFTVWAVALGFVLISAFAWGTQVGRWRLTVLIAGTLALPVLSDALTANTYGLAFQGRYVFPLAVGIPLLAAFMIGSSDVLTRVQQAGVVRVLIWLLLPFQFISLAYMMDRWQSGVGPGHSLNPLRGSWHPVIGSGIPLLALTVGLIIFGCMVWRAALPVDEQPAGRTESAAELLPVPGG
jgi:hypothetical protein